MCGRICPFFCDLLCFIFNSLIHMQVLRSSWNLGSVEIYSRPIMIKYLWIFMDGLINVFSMLDIVDCRLSTTVNCKLERWSNAAHIHLKSRFPATVMVLPDWGSYAWHFFRPWRPTKRRFGAESERIRLWTVESEIVVEIAKFNVIFNRLVTSDNITEIVPGRQCEDSDSIPGNKISL